MSVAVKVLKSLRRTGTYVYLRVEDEFDDLPEGFRAAFGRAELVLELDLTPDRTLARADAAAVLGAIAEQGFYLQLPPTVDELADGHG